LRHTLAVILRESGCDERTIADALGQRTIEMARRYAKGADLKGIDQTTNKNCQTGFEKSVNLYRKQKMES
jgi:hypothetical protein